MSSGAKRRISVTPIQILFIMLYLELFLTFFQIGLFGFGGGYAMLSMIQGEVVTSYGWLRAPL